MEDESLGMHFPHVEDWPFVESWTFETDPEQHIHFDTRWPFYNGSQETSSSPYGEMKGRRKDGQRGSFNRSFKRGQERHNGAVTSSARHEKRFRWSGTRAMRHYARPPFFWTHASTTVASFSCATKMAIKGNIPSKTFGDLHRPLSFAERNCSAYRDDVKKKKRPRDKYETFTNVLTFKRWCGNMRRSIENKK